MYFLPTLRIFVKKALIPVGNTMYIYGGGWNSADTGAGETALCPAPSPGWQKFFNSVDKNFDFHNFLYKSDLGLDCTGYIGWCLYSLFYPVCPQGGFVFKSSSLGERLRALGLGSVQDGGILLSHRCGDIFYSAKHRHTYITLGQFSDKSALILHSSPPGVMVSGTSSPLGSEKSIAQKYASFFMQEHFPAWYKKFSDSDRGLQYLTDYTRFRFFEVVLPDPEGLSYLCPDEVLRRVI